MGPRVYDMVALLQDSYQDFDASFVEARLFEYAEAAGLDEGERATLRTEFDLVTIQRKLKDAGRFVFIERVKGNASFVPYIDPSLRKVRAALGRVAHAEPDLEELGAILHRALPEVM
jgi:aminoglycoside/choline kinase family phosphotransferase